MEKKKIHIKAHMPCTLAVSHIECFLEGLRSGDVVVEQGTERIVLHPHHEITLGIEARTKKDTQRLVITMDWCAPHACEDHPHHGKQYKEIHPPHHDHHLHHQEEHPPPPPPPHHKKHHHHEHEDWGHHTPDSHQHEHSHGHGEGAQQHTHEHGENHHAEHHTHDKHGFHAHYHCHGESEHKLCHTHEHAKEHHVAHQHTGCCEEVDHEPHKGCCSDHNYGSEHPAEHAKHEHGHKGCCEEKHHDPHKGCCSDHNYDKPEKKQVEKDKNLHHGKGLGDKKREVIGKTDAPPPSTGAIHGDGYKLWHKGHETFHDHKHPPHHAMHKMFHGTQTNHNPHGKAENYHRKEHTSFKSSPHHGNTK